MKTLKKFLLMLCTIGLCIGSCQKNNSSPEPSFKIPNADFEAIKNLGFDTKNIVIINNGYVVEGDIFLSHESLKKSVIKKNLDVGHVNQYSSNNLVTNLPRTITISVTGLSGNFITAIDNAITRWNNLDLSITFQRTTGTADIDLNGFYQVSGLLGYAGFPDNGNPYNQISLNTYNLNSGSNVDYMTSILQHELGHCVGLRHTDYMDRSYSCGGSYNNEGSTYDPYDPQTYPGAVYISGPSGGDPQSLMLACSVGYDRTFTPNDIIALAYLYRSGTPAPSQVYEYYSSGGADHYLTTNKNELIGNSSWSYQGTQFKASVSSISGAIPIYGFYQSVGADHYFSTNSSIPGSGWSLQGIAFYAFSSSGSGRIPIYEFYQSQGADHYYSSNSSNPGSGWAYHGIAFYALP